MLLPDLLSASARRFPDKDAVVFPEQSISFAALEQAAQKVAARLIRSGIGPGQRVAILYENSLPALLYFWGALFAGAECVDIPTLAGVPAILTMLEESRPSALVVSQRQLARVTADRQLSPELSLFSAAEPSSDLGERDVTTIERVLAEEEPLTSRVARDSSDVALVVYTSGTTGRPKGVMLTHENLFSNIVAFNSRIQLTSEDSLLVVVPLHFIHGRTQLLTHVWLGATLVFSAGFQFPKVVLEELARYRVTGISGVPYHFITLLRATKLKSTPLPNLKNITITGGALAPTALRELADAQPHVRLHVNDGQTESAPRLTYLGPDEIFERVGSCGRALPGVKIEILDSDGHALPIGEVGEVVASSPGIMKGYVSGDERSSGRIDDQGRLHTGDLGRLDSDGYLYLAGRSSEMIKSAGERIFPREVEEVLDLCPGVVESAVFGLPDPILGEKLVACVVLQEGVQVSPSDLRAHCLESLSLVRTPRELRFVKTLPKTASGKIIRAALTETFLSAGA